MREVTRACRECGALFPSRQHNAAFCSDRCRRRHNRRRITRGAELYDIVMSARFERPGERPEPGLYDRMIQAYRSADLALRSGRPSWQKVTQAITRLPISYSEQGDGR